MSFYYRSLKLNLDTIDDMAVEEESHGKGPKVLHVSNARLEIDWIEKEICIKCDESSELLVCSNSICPIAVHEKCLICSPHHDSSGNFICPYCAYKQVVFEKREAKKKAMLAKKALSALLDKRVVGVPCNGSTSSAINGENDAIGSEKSDIDRDSQREIEKLLMISHREEEIASRLGFEMTSESARERNPMMQKMRNLVVEREIAIEGTLNDVEIEENTVHNLQKKRVFQQGEGVINKRRKLGDEPLEDNSQNKTTDQHDQEMDVREKEKLGVEHEKSIEKQLENGEIEEEIQELGKESNLQNKGEIDLEHDDVASDSSDGIAKKRNENFTKSESSRRSLVVEREISIEGTLNDAEIEENTVHNLQKKRVFQEGEGVINKRRKLDDEPLEVEDNSQNQTTDQHDQVVGEKEKLGVENENSIEKQLENEEIEEEIQEPEKESNLQNRAEIDLEHDDVSSDSSDLRAKKRNEKFAKGESSRQTANEAQKGKSNGRSRSRTRQSIPRVGFPQPKRSRRPWTAEEEEMLKEGVGRFANKVVKNIPWKSILNFGRHVFDVTRTPDNLKDKWRNMTG